MTVIKISVGEHWARIYHIEAESLREAKKKYKEYLRNGAEHPDVIYVGEPEYIEDISDDIVEVAE